MLKLSLLLFTTMLLVCCGTRSSADDVANQNEKPVHEPHLVGAYTDLRVPSAEDSALFFAATRDSAYMNLTPLAVATQVVAGTNYLFNCSMKDSSGEHGGVVVKIFVPLPGRGEPQLVSIDR